MSAIKSILAAEGIHINYDEYKLSALIKANKLENHKVTLRMLININLLNLDKIEDFFQERGQPYLAALYRALTASGYYGLLRVGEMTESNHQILVANMHMAVNKRKVQFVSRTSKTHTASEIPQRVTIISDQGDNNYCPFQTIRNFIKLRQENSQAITL